MQLHSIKRQNSRKKSAPVGRGGKRGKTAGRGTKGQKARAGHKIRPEIRDTIKKIPKLRGYAFNAIPVKEVTVSLSKIDSVFNNGEVVSPKTLIEKKVITTQSGKIPVVKILSGEISKKVTLEGLQVSKTAKEAIEKAGGSIVSSK